MESKRAKAYRRGAENVLPFNRTSMESKHGRVLQYIRYTKLLIEPVWNRNANRTRRAKACRNAFNRTSMESKHQTFNPTIPIPEPFNRTSMESKLGFDRDPRRRRRTFNRTSMESKQI